MRRARPRHPFLVGCFLIWMGAPAVQAAHVDVAPIADEVIQRLVHEPLTRRGPNAPEALRGHLDGVATLLTQLVQDDRTAPATDAAAPTAQLLLASKVHELRATRTELRAVMADVQGRLTALGAADQAAAWAATVARIEAKFDGLLRALDAVAAATARADRARATATARAELRRLHEDVKARERAAASPTPVPTFTQGVPRSQEPEGNTAPPPAHMASPRPGNNVYAFLGHTLLAQAPSTPSQAQACGYTSADLGQSQEVQFTAEVQALAASLGYSPARIYQYVANTFAFEPYYGSLRGAVGTLYAQSGNATDQASLLIALLRASNIPARYVRGTAQFVDDARLPRWLGTKTQLAAVYILRYGQIPTAYSVANGSEIVQFTHVWVEACVPYADYRGTAVDLGGHRWVPLDPSFKDKAYQAGIATNVSFDYTGYLAGLTNDLPHERYGQQVETAIKTLPPNYANNTLADVGYTGAIVPRRVDILPASLPYQVVAFNAWDTGLTAETAEVPDTHRIKLTITVANGAGSALAPATTLSMPQVALQRVTLSFKGATPGDQTALDAWRNDPNLDASLPATINVIPVIRVDGVDTTVGTAAVNLTTVNNRLTMTLTTLADVPPGQPPYTLNTVTSTIQAANYHALEAYAYQTSDRLLRERAARLLTSVQTYANPQANQEETIGEYLHLAGLKYMRYLSDGITQVGQLDGGSGRSGPHLGLTSTWSKASYVFDEPFAVYRKGFLVDVGGAQIRNVDISTGQQVWKTFNLAGYTGSAYESYLWQENARLDAVSAVRGIQFANANGIEVLTLTSANWAAQSPKLTSNSDPSLNYTSAEVATLQNAVNGGATATAPRSHLRIQNWTGSVWITEKPQVGNAYIISGRYSGGASLLPPDIGCWGACPTGYWITGAPPATGTIATPSTVNDASNYGLNTLTTTGGDPVNLVTGNMYHTERDMAIKGRGLPLVFERSYNSRRARDDSALASPPPQPLGWGWTHSFNHSLVFKDDNANGVADAPDTDGITDSVTWTDGTGNLKFIVVRGDSSGVPIGSTFTTPKGFFFRVARNADGTYTITEKNGLAYTFENVAGTVGQRAKVLRVADRYGNTLTLNYTGSLLTSVTDGLNRSLTFTYDANNRVTQVTDWTNRTHQYSYEASGNLIAYKNPLAVAGSQNPVTYSYYSDAQLNHMMQSYTLPRGNGMTFQYYMNGKVFKHYNTLGETTTFTYNEFRREAITVNERGFTRLFFFDQYANPTKIVEENGGERTYTYDAPNNPYNRLSKRDPEGYITSYTYDANGNVTQVTLPSGNTVQYSSFNAFNQPGKIKDARGNYTLIKYDANGNALQVLKLKSGLGASIDPTTYTPNAAHLVAWAVNTYDSYGNVLTTKQVRDFTAQVGPSVEFSYNDTVNGVNGLNAVTITRRGDKNGDGVIGAGEFDTATLAYDNLGRVTTGLRPDWYQTQFVYDAVDRVTRGTDALGQMRDYAFDPNGNLVSEGLTVAGTLVDQRTATYDMSDRKVTSTNAAGAITTSQYDPAGNVTQVTDPDGRTLRFDYDPNNQVTRATDQRGNAVSTTRDLSGKPRTMTDPNGNTVATVYYGSERDGRVKQRLDPLRRITQYDYDANGNATRVTDNLGRTNLTTYDELNRPTRVVGPTYTDPTLGLIRPVAKTTYDPLGRVTSVSAGRTDSAGTNPGSDVVTTQMAYTYDDFGRKLKETDPLGRAWVFTYDVNGNPFTVTDPQGQVTSATWGYGHQLLTRTAQGPATPALVALTGASRSWPAGYTRVYAGKICVANSSGACIGSDLTPEAGVGTALGYVKTTNDPGTAAAYRAACYSTTGSCVGYSLSQAVNGTPMGYVATAPPDAQSAAFIDSGGLLLQGLTGTPSAYLWTNPSGSTTLTDHMYVTTESIPADYTSEGVTAYVRPSSGTGTKALTRYVNAVTGAHFYTADPVADPPPSADFGAEATLGYLDFEPGAGRVPLARHSNATTRDYRLTTSITPPGGYTYQATLGYAYPPSPGTLVALTRAARSWGDPLVPLFRGGICVADGRSACIGGDVRAEAGLGPQVGYMRTSTASGTVPVYRAGACYVAGGACGAYSLSLDVNGTPVGYLSTTPPDQPSQTAPFVQSGGLLLQGLAGTPAAYLWTSPAGATRTDHVYATDGAVPAGYTDEGVTGYLRQTGGTGTLALTRYVNAATGSHHYSTAAEAPPGYTADGTLGYLDPDSRNGGLPLARHYNPTTGDYLLENSITSPPGYTYQATLGYLQPPGASPGGPIVTTYTRNALGQVTQAANPNVTYTYTYDAAHRLQSVTDSRGPKTLTYGYSPGGLRNSVSDSDGNQTSYLYDPVGRLIGIWAPTGDLVAFAYDAGGRLVEKSFPNGANTRYTYNPDNTLARVINRVGSSDASVLSQHTYTYDGVGNRITHTERIGATTTPYAYAYDPLNRLTQVSNSATGAVLENDTYDPLGNRLTKTSGSAVTYYRYDAANQLTQSCADAACNTVTGTFTYDLTGNLVSRTDGASTTMAYDAENRLAWISVAGQLEQSYAYDDQGRRVRKTVGATTTQYLYEGPNILAEYTTWAAPTARTTHGPGMDAPLLRAAATTQYFHQDGLGSVVALSNANGGTDATSRYDAWGVRISGTGTIPVYGYTGREPDETGLIYYRARYYDPTLGRFTQRDPIGLTGGLNLYGYVGGNPVNFTDPLGLTRVPENTVLETISTNYFQPSAPTSPGRRSLADLDLSWTGTVSDVDPIAISGLHAQRGAAILGFVGTGVGTVVGGVACGGGIFVGCFAAAYGVDSLISQGSGNPSLTRSMLETITTPGGAAVADALLGSVLFAGTGVALAARVAAAPTELAAASAPWAPGIQRYLHGDMTVAEHIFYRHGPNSGFTNVSKFAEGTSLRDVRNIVNEAFAQGTRSGSSITYDLGRVIGTNPSGKPATGLQIFLNSAGEVRTAYPY